MAQHLRLKWPKCGRVFKKQLLCMDRKTRENGRVAEKRIFSSWTIAEDKSMETNLKPWWDHGDSRRVKWWQWMIQEIKMIPQIKNPAGGENGGVEESERSRGEEKPFRKYFHYLTEASGSCVSSSIELVHSCSNTHTYIHTHKHACM